MNDRSDRNYAQHRCLIFRGTWLVCFIGVMVVGDVLYWPGFLALWGIGFLVMWLLDGTK